ncbi:MAG: hypothetical protein WC346_10165 [Methanogenium sp.]|jgi:hypothetical protein
MIFDKFCGLVERYWPELKFYADKARIFEFPGVAHGTLPKEIGNFEWYKENFFLPFNTVAIEDESSLVILHDLSKGAKGLFLEREFIECVPMDRGDKFADGPAIEKEFGKLPPLAKDWFLILKGTIQYEMANDSWYKAFGSLKEGILCSKDVLLLGKKEFWPFVGKNVDVQRLTKSEIRNANTAIEQLMYFNNPDRFVVEMARQNMRLPNNKKILRSEDRPHYVLLKPNEIRKLVGEPSVVHSHSSPRLHERRRHIRTFRSEKYVNMKDKSIIIPATWIGKSEYTIKNTRYRVLLEI